MNTKIIIVIAIVAFACLMAVVLRRSYVKMQTPETQNIQTVTPSLDNGTVSANDPDMKEVEKELNDLESSIDASSFNGI